MFWQLCINALISASILFGLAIGFMIIYSTTRFFHFAHGIVYTIGAYLFFLFSALFHLPIYLSVSISIILSAFLGCLMDIFIYRPLRHRRTSSLILLLASIGIYIILQNVISIIFGDDTKAVSLGTIEEGYKVFNARITPIQILIVCASFALTVIVWFILRYSRLGKIMRAVGNNPELAKVSGINNDRVILLTFAIGSALAGISGLLISLDIYITPTMGMHALMMAVVTMIIGGVGSIPGIAFGALLLAFAQNFGVWKISSQWQDAIAFGILLVFLIFRPQGFLGKKIKKATV